MHVKNAGNHKKITPIHMCLCSFKINNIYWEIVPGAKLNRGNGVMGGPYGNTIFVVIT